MDETDLPREKRDICPVLRATRPFDPRDAFAYSDAFGTCWLGGSPNLRAYSRLNWLELSYPTAYAAVVTVAPPAIKSRRASSRRSSFWYCSGVVDVIALKCS